jgi:hypothetical protein
MRRSNNAALFCSGIFFGGAVDHAVLALRRENRTPYGVNAGVAANWAFAVLDVAVATAFYAAHRRAASVYARRAKVERPQSGAAAARFGADRANRGALIPGRG